VESLISPCGTVQGLPEKSPHYEDSMRSPYISMWSPCRLHVNSKESQCYTRTGPHGVQVNSYKTPWRLPGLHVDSIWSPGLRVA
jgi:hypothetical protein